MRIPLFLIFLIIASICSAAQREPSLSDLQLEGGTSALCPTADQFSLGRPESDSGSTRVRIAVYVMDITRFDDVEQYFTADLYFVMQWKDARLANPSRGDSSSICSLPMDRVWHPVIQFDRIRRWEKLYRDLKLVDSEGNITFAQRLNVDVSVKLDLRDFPFDRHLLTIGADPVIASIDEVEFDILENLTGREDNLSITGWRVGDPEARVTTEYAPRRFINISKFQLDIGIKREAAFFVWKALIPLMFIVFMSWAVFWIDPGQFVRIGLSATSMLTLIAYQFAFSNLLPRISYLTRADRFTVCSSIIIFFALVEATLTSSLAKMGKLKLASRIDLIARWVFPLAFAGTILFAFLI